MGRLLMAATEGMQATDAKTFVIHLKQPFPLMLDALGKPSSILSASFSSGKADPSP